MTEKLLGTITSAEYGKVLDYPFEIGLQLGFRFCDGSGVTSGSTFTVNVSKANRHRSEKMRTAVIAANVETISEILRSAKCSYVSQLVGKPVVVALTNNKFEAFSFLPK